MRPTLLLLLTTAACTGRDGSWPSLGHRAIEGPAVYAAGSKCAAGAPTCGAVPAVVPAVLPPASPEIPVAVADVASRLAVIDRDIGDAAGRLAQQRVVSADAARLAVGAKPDSAAWARAQLEATALDRVGNQLTDIRARLDTIAGTLAAASASGTDVSVPLAATGRAIVRLTALQGDAPAATPR